MIKKNSEEVICLLKLVCKQFPHLSQRLFCELILKNALKHQNIFKGLNKKPPKSSSLRAFFKKHKIFADNKTWIGIKNIKDILGSNFDFLKYKFILEKCRDIKIFNLVDKIPKVKKPQKINDQEFLADDDDYEEEEEEEDDDDDNV